jgi:hypothetical protein
MEPDLQEIVDRLEGVERGSGAWVNLADAFIARVRAAGASAPATGTYEEEEEGPIVLKELSDEAREAFRYGSAQCEALGMEIIGPIIGYPDERQEILDTIQGALQKWRLNKDGEAPPEPLKAVADDEAAPEEAAAT